MFNANFHENTISKPTKLGNCLILQTAPRVQDSAVPSPVPKPGCSLRQAVKGLEVFGALLSEYNVA